LDPPPSFAVPSLAAASQASSLPQTAGQGPVCHPVHRPQIQATTYPQTQGVQGLSHNALPRPTSPFLESKVTGLPMLE